MKLIDASRLINETDDRYTLNEIGRRERDDIVNALEFAPTVDAEPVRHGKWTRHTVGSAEYGTTVMYRCNKCETGTISKYKYCPYCGARMDEE